ncbi:IQ domain-containing protein [Seminavis robusta]|uniref:IQ domain-containing protein n=1 Tax=Seminavis robusta TaxID=568900 RepID=A0A9N8HRE8_9STRA|nr:IQ domain-containing protein [Seminavis robusta]|eukprot:Sro1559_g282460.1 IQ domain-containing protein (406) ;mRNA; r:12471-13688
MTCGFVMNASSSHDSSALRDSGHCYPFICRSRSQNRLLAEATRFYEAVEETEPVEEPRRVKEIVEEGDSSSEEEDKGAPAAETKAASQRRTSRVIQLETCLTNLETCFSESAQTTPKSSQQQPFSHLLPLSIEARIQGDIAYRGISANPPEIIRSGVNRGNVAQIHRKAWLEVSDSKHRYGKNLRLYYRHWESLGYPTNHFFDWLDSNGAAAGKPLPDLPECPRSVLDSDTVLYIRDPEVTSQYALELERDETGKCRVSRQRQPVTTGPNGWIFVLRDSVIYGAEKVKSAATGQRFHHSSFFGGKAVAAAGIFITDAQGYLEMLYPHSGHYRPGEADMQRVLYFLHQQGIDLNSFQVDIQQLIRVCRQEAKGSKKAGGADDRKKRKKDRVSAFEASSGRGSLLVS